MLTGQIIVGPRASERIGTQELKDWMGHPAMNVWNARIDQMIEKHRDDCAAAETIEDLRRIQGSLKALQTVRQLPEILLKEHERAGKKQETKHDVY